MASLNSAITIQTEIRPCYVGERKGLFHKWEEVVQIYDPLIRGRIGGQIGQTFALVEFEDGSVERCEPHEVKFCDNRLREYAFPEQAEVRNDGK